VSLARAEVVRGADPASLPISDCTLQVEVSDATEYTGYIELDLTRPLTTSVSVYILMPFALRDAQPPEHVRAVWDTLSPEGFTALTLLLSSDTPSSIRIGLKVIPRLVSSDKFRPIGLEEGSNFLIVEDRGIQSTLYLRFSIDPREAAFGRFAEFTSGSLTPSTIRIEFPQGTTFTTLPPENKSSNIDSHASAGFVVPGQNLYVTTPDFYRGDYLWINYQLPAPAWPLSSILLWAGLGFCTLASFALALPEEILAKRWRLVSAAVALVIAPILVFVGVRLARSPSNLESTAGQLIVTAIVFSFSALVLVLQAVPGIKRFFGRLFAKLKRPKVQIP